MTLTIDIPEKVVERAKELGVPVNTLVLQTLDALAADEDHRPPPMIDFSRPHRVPPFSGETVFTKAERDEIAEFRRLADAHMARVTRTPETALQELVDAGICYPDGQLTEHYR
jgi:hypothetical protein